MFRSPFTYIKMIFSIGTVILLTVQSLYAQDSGKTIDLSISPLYTNYFSNRANVGSMSYSPYDSLIYVRGSQGIELDLKYAYIIDSKYSLLLGIHGVKRSYKERVVREYFYYDPFPVDYFILDLEIDIYTFGLSAGVRYILFDLKKDKIFMDHSINMDISIWQYHFKPILSYNLGVLYAQKLSRRIDLSYGICAQQAFYMHNFLLYKVYPYQIGVQLGAMYTL